MKAISLALLRIRADGWTLDALGKELDCSGETIANASNEKTLLEFTSLALLAFKFPDQWRLIESVWGGAVASPVTMEDRIERIERELAAIRRGLA